MTLDAVQFVSLLLNGVASGVVLSHVLERPGKVALAPATYVQVQQMLFRTYGPAVGALETLALLAIATWWALDQAWLVGLAVLADTAMIGVWAIWINPINQRVNPFASRCAACRLGAHTGSLGDAAYGPRDPLAGSSLRTSDYCDLVPVGAP